MGMNLNSENNILAPYNGVPLGCSKPVGSRDELCYLKFDVTQADDDASCVTLADNDQESHHLCGVSVVGLTKYGLDKYGDNSVNIRQSYNGTNGFSVLEYFGAHLKLESNGDINGQANILIPVYMTSNTVGHRLWDYYTTQTIEVTFSL